MLRRAVILLAACVLTPGPWARAETTTLLAQPVELTAQFPQEIGYESELDTDLSGLAELRVSLFLPPEAPVGTTVLVYLKDAQWNWYQVEQPTMLKPGRVNVIKLDMTARSTMWKPKGHSRGWDGYVTQKIRAIGLKLFNVEPWQGTIRLERVIGDKLASGARPFNFLDVRADAQTVGRYGKYELSFDLSRTYENPYDPAEIDVTGEFTAPSGKTFSIPGFYYRQFTRRRTGLGEEELVPVGRSFWKLRFAPTELGTYTVTLRARESAESVETDPLTFNVVASDDNGFVRVDKQDPYFFSFDNGKFFYPIGQMLRSPTDLRVPYPYEFTMKEGEGTFAFDRYFERLSANGVNFIRTWMGNWWLGIEAAKTYDPAYEGLGKYNMENAWKLDYILEQARRRGIYVELTLLNHGLFQTKTDSEWYENPYNELNGGPLSSSAPARFFTDETARKYFKRRLRYIVARWGYDTHLAAWEMWNEVDLIQGYSSSDCRQWHQEMIDYVKSIDPYRHVTTTHFCRQPMDPNVNNLPQIEFTQSDLYSNEIDSPRIVTGVRSTWLSKMVLGKGTLINEYGTGKDMESLEANFHGGLWTSTVLPMTGTAMFWWWPWVDAHDLYWHYKPVAMFNEGEDRRGRNMRLTSPEVLDSSGKTHAFLATIGSQNNTSAYLWIYDELIFEYTDGPRYKNPPAFVATTLRLPGLEAGPYLVQFYSTVTGQVVDTQHLTSDGEWMTVKLPTVQADVAVKVKPERVGP